MSDYTDRIIERGQSDWQRLQDARARKSGRFVEYVPHDRAIKPTGPTCPKCSGSILLSGNMAICNRRGCCWQGLSGYDPDIARSEYAKRTAA